MEEGLKYSFTIEDPSFVKDNPLTTKYNDIKRLTTLYLPMINKPKPLDGLVNSLDGLNRNQYVFIKLYHYGHYLTVP